jgi:hypothetical protein
MLEENCSYIVITVLYVSTIRFGLSCVSFSTGQADFKYSHTVKICQAGFLLQILSRLTDVCFTGYSVCGVEWDRYAFGRR